MRLIVRALGWELDLGLGPWPDDQPSDARVTDLGIDRTVYVEQDRDPAEVRIGLR